MKKLVPLPDPPSALDRFVEIRNRKQAPTRQVLIDHHDVIAARYEEFAACAAAGTLEAISPSPLLVISEPLRHCYDVQTKKLVALKNAINDAQPLRQLKYCPYCGTTGHDTHDHYLPGVRFPEFAVNSLNLIPCCFMCNAKKDDDWLDQAGRRRYLHFYLDEIPDVDFLFVDLITAAEFESVGAQFRIERGIISDATWGLIERHYERLDLLSRYGEAANDEIGEMLQAGADYMVAGGPDVRFFLLTQSQSAAQVYGRNNWRAVLLARLAEHPDLEGWIEAIAV